MIVALIMHYYMDFINPTDGFCHPTDGEGGREKSAELGMMNFELWITDRRLRREAVGEGSEFCVLGSELEIMNLELGMMKVVSGKL